MPVPFTVSAQGYPYGLDVDPDGVPAVAWRDVANSLLRQARKEGRRGREMNDAEELVEHFKQGILSKSDLFISFFRLTDGDFAAVDASLPGRLQLEFYSWARWFCESGGSYIQADGYAPIKADILRAYEVWARAQGKW